MRLLVDLPCQQHHASHSYCCAPIWFKNRYCWFLFRCWCWCWWAEVMSPTMFHKMVLSFHGCHQETDNHTSSWRTIWKVWLSVPWLTIHEYLIIFHCVFIPGVKREYYPLPNYCKYNIVEWVGVGGVCYPGLSRARPPPPFFLLTSSPRDRATWGPEHIIT